MFTASFLILDRASPDISAIDVPPMLTEKNLVLK